MSMMTRFAFGGLVATTALASARGAAAGEWCDQQLDQCSDDAINDCGSAENLSFFSFTCDDTSEPYGSGCSWGCNTNNDYCWTAEWDCVQQAMRECGGIDWDIDFTCDEGFDTSSCDVTCLWC